MPSIMPALSGLDKAIFSGLNRLSGGWLDTPLAWISLSADFTVLMVVGLILIYYFAGEQRFQKAFAFCLALLLLNLSVDWLKLFVARPRPFVVFGGDVLRGVFEGRHPAEIPLSGAFPSGHAAASFAVALFLNGIFKHRLRFLYLWAFLVSLSRVYFGLHYPSDILAGALLGLVFSGLGLQLLKRWEGLET